MEVTKTTTKTKTTAETTANMMTTGEMCHENGGNEYATRLRSNSLFDGIKVNVKAIKIKIELRSSHVEFWIACMWMWPARARQECGRLARAQNEGGTKAHTRGMSHVGFYLNHLVAGPRAPGNKE